MSSSRIVEKPCYEKKLLEEERWGWLYLFQTRANQTHNSKIAKSLVNTKRNTMKIVHIQRIQYNMILTLAQTFFTIIHSQLKERYYNPYYFLSLSLSLSFYLTFLQGSYGQKQNNSLSPQPYRTGDR